MSGLRSWREMPVMRSMSSTRLAGTRVHEYRAVCLIPSSRARATIPPVLPAASATISIMVGNTYHTYLLSSI